MLKNYDNNYDCPKKFKQNSKDLRDLKDIKDNPNYFNYHKFNKNKKSKKSSKKKFKLELNKLNKLKKEQFSPMNSFYSKSNLFKKYIKTNFKDAKSNLRNSPNPSSKRILTDHSNYSKAKKWISPGKERIDVDKNEKSYYLIKPKENSKMKNKQNHSFKNLSSFGYRTIRHNKSPSSKINHPDAFKSFYDSKRYKDRAKWVKKIKEKNIKNPSYKNLNNSHYSQFKSFSKETQKLLKDIQNKLAQR